MKYKYISDTVLAKIDDDGKSRLSCSVENEDYQAWVAAGNTPDPMDAPTPEEIKAEIVVAVQSHMDTTAQTRNYDNIHTLASYENSLDVTFKAEGTAGRIWRDEVWVSCRQILSDVQTGTRPMPTVAEVISELPIIGW